MTNSSANHPLYIRVALFGAILALTSGAPPVLGCSECGCTLSSDWSAQGYPDTPGLTASARLEYYESNDLRTGTGRVNAGAVAYPTDQEIQRETLNRNMWLGLDYVGANGWAVEAQLPFLDRYHRTIAEGDTTESESCASGVGDLRLLARYQKFSMYRSIGFQFGLKLPTGGIDQTFATGPQTGEPLDRGLQLGSGTTDLLAGASLFRRPTPNLGWFVQVLGDLPLHERRGFIPSANIVVNTGVRWLNSTAFTPQLQVNARWDAREHGPEADTANSGGFSAYLSPGLTAELGSRTTGFVFVQVPVYRRLNGLQLTPKAIISLGVTCRL
ncbi:MAG TPA: hypothetical protein VHE61_04540 [Opitutaceae bacterium]|nr:hypothetical protein [Opitutaceae bacterium]